jgi:hypothetical protein
VDATQPFPDIFIFIGTVPVMFSPTSLSVTVPLALLGGDDGLVNYDAIIGVLDEPTDLAPNGPTPATSAFIPEPATIGLFAAAFIVMGVIRRRRRPGFAGT